MFFYVLKSVVCMRKRCLIMVSSECIDTCNERDIKSREKDKERAETC